MAGWKRTLKPMSMDPIAGAQFETTLHKKIAPQPVWRLSALLLLSVHKTADNWQIDSLTQGGSVIGV